MRRNQIDRSVEIEKYARAYESPKYRMGDERKANSALAIERYQTGETFLDIGAGRGEMLDHAVSLGFKHVKGTEVVPELLKDSRLEWAEAHNLPFGTSAWDVVTCFDVLEHLIDADVTPCIDELFRVARHVLIVSAASDSQCWKGVEQHPSRRPLKEWESLLVSRAPRGRWSLRESLPCRKNSGMWVFKSI